MTRDGSAVLCQRVEAGAVKRVGEAGWLHRLGDDTYRPPRRRRRVALEALAPSMGVQAGRCRARAEKAIGFIERLADGLGLSAATLRRFEVGLDYNDGASTWPMRDALGRIIGIVRRLPDGRKLCVRGSRAGLYMPGDLPFLMNGARLLICEGGSDAAAGIGLGFWSIGRFSCSHGGKLLTRLIESRRPAEVVIVSDADGPGRAGADRLARELAPLVESLRIIEAPEGVKDLRQWKAAGADYGDVVKAIEAAPRWRVSVGIRRRRGAEKSPSKNERKP